jgi:hypothetical protein
MIQERTFTRQWTRWSGTLQECLQKATGIYHQPHADQGNPVWRVLVPGVEIGRCEKNAFLLEELLECVKRRPEATKQAILEYDPGRDGQIQAVNWMNEQKDSHIWVFAKLYLAGKNEPVALIYHIDFEDEEKDGSPEEKTQIRALQECVM